MDQHRRRFRIYGDLSKNPRPSHELVLFPGTTNETNALLFNSGHESLARPFQNPPIAAGNLATTYLISMLREAGIDTTRLETGLSAEILQQFAFTSYVQWIQAVKVVMYDKELPDMENEMLKDHPEVTADNIVEYCQTRLHSVPHPRRRRGFKHSRLIDILTTEGTGRQRELGHGFIADESFFREWKRVSYRIAAAMIVVRYETTDGIGWLRFLVDSDVVMVELQTITTEDDRDRWTGGRPLTEHTIEKLDQGRYDWIAIETRTRRAYNEARRFIRARSDSTGASSNSG